MIIKWTEIRLQLGQENKTAMIVITTNDCGDSLTAAVSWAAAASKVCSRPRHKYLIKSINMKCMWIIELAKFPQELCGREQRAWPRQPSQLQLHKVLNKVLRMEKVSPVSEVVKSCQDREGGEEAGARWGVHAEDRENGQICHLSTHSLCQAQSNLKSQIES